MFLHSDLHVIAMWFCVSFELCPYSLNEVKLRVELGKKGRNVSSLDEVVLN